MRPAALLLLVALAVPAASFGADGKDDAALQKRLDQLEEENAKLRADLAKANAETKKLFDAATAAEKSAGLSFRKPTAVAAQSAPATVPPVGQAATRHASARFDHEDVQLDVSFGPLRSVRTWRVHDANCTVTRKYK